MAAICFDIHGDGFLWILSKYSWLHCVCLLREMEAKAGNRKCFFSSERFKTSETIPIHHG